jgi:hypothetical protein
MLYKINMSVVPKINTDVHKRCEEVRDESQLKMFDIYTLGHTCKVFVLEVLY